MKETETITERLASLQPVKRPSSRVHEIMQEHRLEIEAARSRGVSWEQIAAALELNPNTVTGAGRAIFGATRKVKKRRSSQASDPHAGRPPLTAAGARAGEQPTPKAADQVVASADPAQRPKSEPEAHVDPALGSRNGAAVATEKDHNTGTLGEEASAPKFTPVGVGIRQLSAAVGAVHRIAADESPASPRKLRLSSPK